jgi:hypothetical protein
MAVLRWALGLGCALSILMARSLAAPNCPIIGLELPPPRDLYNHPVFKTAIENITAVFEALDGDRTYGSQNYSYSVQVFSSNPGQSLLFERYHTAENIPVNTTGVQKVDANTVYRLGSLTKVFTVLTFLAEAGDEHFNTPITKFVPELAEIAANASAVGPDAIRNVDWEDVTIGSLASQISGIGNNCKWNNSAQLLLVAAQVLCEYVIIPEFLNPLTGPPQQLALSVRLQ